MLASSQLLSDIKPLHIIVIICEVCSSHEYYAVILDQISLK